jgi:hypothetical protein
MSSEEHQGASGAAEPVAVDERVKAAVLDLAGDVERLVNASAGAVQRNHIGSLRRVIARLRAQRAEKAKVRLPAIAAAGEANTDAVIDAQDRILDMQEPEICVIIGKMLVNLTLHGTTSAEIRFSEEGQAFIVVAKSLRPRLRGVLAECWMLPTKRNSPTCRFGIRQCPMARELLARLLVDWDAL